MSTEITTQDWDAIIIGTGMGGAVLGHALARSGLRILFLEKGHAPFHATALRGGVAESFFPSMELPRPDHRDVLARAGRCWEEIVDQSSGQTRRFIPLLGCGAGGSTALYGMALERFLPADFQPRCCYPQVGDSTLPETWPITYEVLRPYYEQAEKLFRVRGSADPLRGEARPNYLPPPAFGRGNQELVDFLRSKALHPYHLPMACEYEHGDDRSQGFLDAQGCKNDAARICLQPALEVHGARLLDQCAVIRLEASRTSVREVVCRRHGAVVRLRGRVVVLAAGTLATPRLLLRSKCARWPHGLANRSRFVGRNLMRHFLDLYLVFPHSPGPYPGNIKQIAFNDLYLADGQKFGTVQSFGPMIPVPLMLAGLEHELRGGSWGWAAPFFRLLKPVLRLVLERDFSRGLVLASILEDLPYADNRIVASDEQSVLSYRMRPADMLRLLAFRRRLAAVLSPYRYRLIKQAENNERLAHACGTCRFGDDPKTSVLDRDNRAHGLDNLYVVDASFFPSSGGTNPSLTIAANALRVAERLGADQFARTVRAVEGAIHATP